MGKGRATVAATPIAPGYHSTGGLWGKGFRTNTVGGKASKSKLAPAGEALLKAISNKREWKKWERTDERRSSGDYDLD